ILDHDSWLEVTEIVCKIIATRDFQIHTSKPALVHNFNGYLGFMYVEEKFKGLVINKFILQSFVYCRQQQRDVNFYLDVYVDNNSAVRAYEKFGFRGSLLEMKLVL